MTEENIKNSPANFDSLSFRLPEKFQALNKLVLRDLNGMGSSPTFPLYTRDQITEFLKNPYQNEKNLRDAVIYIYNSSSHFRRLIQYFASLSLLTYVVSPHKIDTSKENPISLKRNYSKVIELLSSMDLQNQLRKILVVCLREDVFYGNMRVGSDNIIIQQLPSDYCSVSVIEENVLNVSFDFSYFDTNSQQLPLYDVEFQTKYNDYLRNRTGLRWQELDSLNSFAVKCNSEILNYAIPPFAGILREVYDIEDYKQLKLTKTEIDNYAMLVMNLELDEENDFKLSLKDARDFWSNLDSVLPDEIGSVLSPMKIEKIGFEKSGNTDADVIMEAEQSLFTAAGVSSLLFNNPKASANALSLSVKPDQAITFGIVKSIEGVLNRFIKKHSFGKKFKVTFLDCSRYNYKEMGDSYLKASQYGLPTISLYCASQGLLQEEMDSLNFLEDDVLNIKERFIPLQSSATLSNKENGAPKKDVEDLTDEGEDSREDE